MSGNSRKAPGHRPGASGTYSTKQAGVGKSYKTSASGPSKASGSGIDARYPMPNVPDNIRKRLSSVLEDDDDDDLFKYVGMKDPPEEKLCKDMFRLPPPYDKKLNLMEKKFYDKGRRFLINLKQKNVPKPPAQASYRYGVRDRNYVCI